MPGHDCERSAGGRSRARPSARSSPVDDCRLGVLAVISFVGGLLEAFSLYLIAEMALVLTQGKQDASPLPGGIGRQPMETAILFTATLLVVRFACWVVIARLQARLVTEVLADVRNRTVGAYLAASWPVQSAERDGRLQELVGMFAFQASAQMSALANTLAAAVQRHRDCSRSRCLRTPWRPWPSRSRARH